MILFPEMVAEVAHAQENFVLILVAVICSAIGLIVGVVILLKLRSQSAKQDALEQNFGQETKESLEGLSKKLDAIEGLAKKLETESGIGSRFFETTSKELKAGREEAMTASDNLRESLDKTIHTQFDTVRKSIETMRDAVSKTLADQREENSKKLDEMRGIVEEKLQKTLETSISASFKQVSERLESVHKLLGELQGLATNVSDLSRIMTNVKTRGTWGEVRLKTLLEDLLAPEQFACNVKPNPRRNEIVEFAIKLPGDEGSNRPLYLPIDSKFPIEDYERIVSASEKGDAEGVKSAVTQLSKSVEKFARDIRDKYISPPYTTDFAILFLPTEGLYAEVLRLPGFSEKVQRECKIVIVGPTTLAALLNSLQVGFHTLAIQRNSAAIGKMLKTVRLEFEKFGKCLETASKKLGEAQSAINKTSKRHEIASGKLRKVETLDFGGAPLDTLTEIQEPEVELPDEADPFDEADS